MNNTTKTKFPDFVVYIPGSNTAADKTIGAIVVVCMIIGITGNISSAFYFWRRRIRSFPHRLYFIVSGVDVCTSLVAFPVVAVLFNGRQPVLFSSYILCGAWTLLFNFLQRFSMFMVLIVSSTRSMAILLPFHRVNKTAALMALGCFGMFLLTVDAVYLGLKELGFVFWSPAGCCGVGPNTIPWGFTWTIYIMQLLVIVFTISLTVFISFVMSSTVLLRRKSIQCTDRDRKSRDVSVTIALFTAVFLICNLPLFTLQLVDNCIVWFKLERVLDNSPFILWYGWLLSHFFFTSLNAALNPCIYYMRMTKLRAWVFGRLGDYRQGLQRTVSGLRSATRRHSVQEIEEEELSGFVCPNKASGQQIVLPMDLQGGLTGELNARYKMKYIEGSGDTAA